MLPLLAGVRAAQVLGGGASAGALGRAELGEVDDALRLVLGLK